MKKFQTVVKNCAVLGISSDQKPFNLNTLITVSGFWLFVCLFTHCVQCTSTSPHKSVSKRVFYTFCYSGHKMILFKRKFRPDYNSLPRLNYVWRKSKMTSSAFTMNFFYHNSEFMTCIFFCHTMTFYSTIFKFLKFYSRCVFGTSMAESTRKKINSVLMVFSLR